MNNGLQSYGACFKLLSMRKERPLIRFYLAIALTASALVSSTHAQGRLSQLQTELSNTTISGYVQDGIFDSFPHTSRGGGNLLGFSHHQRNGNSLSPIMPTLPIDSGGGLFILPVGSTGEFSLDGGGVLDVYFTPPMGVDSVEISRSGLIDQPVTPLIPPTPLDSSFSIQPVPEPSTLALGGLAFGLIAIARKQRRKQP